MAFLKKGEAEKIDAWRDDIEAFCMELRERFEDRSDRWRESEKGTEVDAALDEIERSYEALATAVQTLQG